MENEMNGAVPEMPETPAENKLLTGVEKINGSIEGLLGKLFGFIGKLQWDKWLTVANRFAVALLPAVTAIVGVIGFLLGLICYIKEDARFSDVMNQFVGLVPAVFALLVLPKALALAQSVARQDESDVLRPEFLYLLKLIGGLGCLVYGLVTFNVPLIIVGVLVIICTERPGIANVQPGTPHNCVEEICSILLFPVRVVIALLPLVVAGAVVAGFVQGLKIWCQNGDFGLMFASVTLQTTVGVAIGIPFAVYFLYLLTVFFIVLYKAVASIPHKFDELKGEIKK